MPRVFQHLSNIISNTGAKVVINFYICKSLTIKFYFKIFFEIFLEFYENVVAVYEWGIIPPVPSLAFGSGG